MATYTVRTMVICNPFFYMLGKNSGYIDLSDDKIAIIWAVTDAAVMKPVNGSVMKNMKEFIFFLIEQKALVGIENISKCKCFNCEVMCLLVNSHLQISVDRTFKDGNSMSGVGSQYSIKWVIINVFDINKHRNSIQHKQNMDWFFKVNDCCVGWYRNWKKSLKSVIAKIVQYNHKKMLF